MPRYRIPILLDVVAASEEEAEKAATGMARALPRSSWFSGLSGPAASDDGTRAVVISVWKTLAEAQWEVATRWSEMRCRAVWDE